MEILFISSYILIIESNPYDDLKRVQNITHVKQQTKFYLLNCNFVGISRLIRYYLSLVAVLVLILHKV